MKYKDVFNYLRKNKNFFIFVSVLFVLSIIIGVFYQPEWIKAYVNEMIRSLADQVKGMNFFQLLGFIFKNNLLVSILGLFLGLIISIYPIFIVIVNGYFIGFVLDKAVGVEGVQAILSILPHGIFEIPALIIALGLGVNLGFKLIQNFVEFHVKKKPGWIFILALLPFLLFIVLFVDNLSNKELKKKIFYELKNSFWVLVYVILPLLIIAAIIETGLIFLI